ncbi:tetratricopeptide repeat protein [Thermomonas flagellata]|uniref:tetratricopeptide repeat protein n=1 Tax=Thermomonas flagellata TaxID=2888524 RepID=UPI001F03E9FB|nr:hypothetical protein [Thermomonas flagellata]
MSRARLVVLALVVLAALFAGWRILGELQAERLATSQPEAALRWRPQDPQALRALAERALQQGQPQRAAELARRLLAAEPLPGEAYRVLGQAADAAGERTAATRLYAIAAAHAPRDLPAQAPLVQSALVAGDYPQALARIDLILRATPARGTQVFPLLAQLAQDPGFAAALADALARDPPWREGMMAYLRDPRAASGHAAGRIMEALRTRGALDPQEYADWLDGLLQQGRWGEAYARWAGTVPLPADGRLPLLYNGDFARLPGGRGFDWRLPRVPGVLAEFAPAPGGGYMAWLRFLDRPVGETGLAHALVLAPGRYRLDIRQRAAALRGELGLQWQLACAGPAGELARSDPLEGSFDWRESTLEFTVPSQGCAGVWLRLVNAVPAGAGSRLSGEVWVDRAYVVPMTIP